MSENVSNTASNTASKNISDSIPVPLKTDKELKALAKKACMDKLFIADNGQLKDRMVAFQCILALAGPESIPDDAVALYAEYDNPEYPTSSMSINGYPTFFSCSFLRKDEYIKFIEFYKELKEIFDEY